VRGPHFHGVPKIKTPEWHGTEHLGTAKHLLAAVSDLHNLYFTRELDELNT